LRVIRQDEGVRYGLLLAVAPVAGCGPFFDGIGGSSDEMADAVCPLLD